MVSRFLFFRRNDAVGLLIKAKPGCRQIPGNGFDFHSCKPSKSQEGYLVAVDLWLLWRFRDLVEKPSADRERHMLVKSEKATLKLRIEMSRLVLYR